MNHLSSQSPTQQSPAQQTLDSRFAAIENTLAALKDHILTQRAQAQPAVSPSAQRRINLDHTREMLARRGEVTVSDIRTVLGVSVKTATRLLHALNRTRDGYLFFDPHGSTERLVLLHPSRVSLERAPRSTAN